MQNLDPTPAELEAAQGKAPKKPKSKKTKLFEGASLIVLYVLSGLCLAAGIGVLVVPATWVSWGGVVPPGKSAAQLSNATCPQVTPATAPQSTMTVATNRQSFITNWNSYVTTTMARPEGVRPGCEPMRFAARGPTYKGVVVVWHGFSSCPQEMNMLGPSLAANGYDVIFPLMAGHGNAIVYTQDSPNFLWGFLVMFFGLITLAILLCCRVCPCARCCNAMPCCDADADGTPCCSYKDASQPCSHLCRTRCLYTTCALSAILVVVGLVAWIIALSSGSDFCLSLSFVDGVGPGCGGMSEYNDNLPTDASAYHAEIDAMNAIVAKAPGAKAVTGLSGGGGAALYASMATDATGNALYSRLLTVAPYIDVAVIGGALGPARALGLSELKVDFGNDCRLARRGAGKAGYCNYRLNRLDAMRQVGQAALASLTLPPGLRVETIKVQGDGTVTNKEISELMAKYEGLDASRAAGCVLTHVDSRHSPLSMWNYIHMDVTMEWVPELICQITAFLAAGTPIPTDGATSATETEPSEPVCFSSCDLFCDQLCQQTSCSYDCQTDSFLTCGGVP